MSLLDKIAKQNGSLNREQRLEILAKAGMMLRKELKKSQDEFGDFRMKAYLCPIEAIEHFDNVLAALSKVKENG